MSRTPQMNRTSVFVDERTRPFKKRELRRQRHRTSSGACKWSFITLSRSHLSRETVKKEVAQQAQSIWDKRLTFDDLKCRFPTLNVKVNEELLVDKERPVKKTDRVSCRLCTFIHLPHF